MFIYSCRAFTFLCIFGCGHVTIITDINSDRSLCFRKWFKKESHQLFLFDYVTRRRYIVAFLWNRSTANSARSLTAEVKFCRPAVLVQESAHIFISSNSWDLPWLWGLCLGLPLFSGTKHKPQGIKTRKETVLLLTRLLRWLPSWLHWLVGGIGCRTLCSCPRSRSRSSSSPGCPPCTVITGPFLCFCSRHSSPCWSPSSVPTPPGQWRWDYINAESSLSGTIIPHLMKISYKSIRMLNPNQRKHKNHTKVLHPADLTFQPTIHRWAPSLSEV